MDDGDYDDVETRILAKAQAKSAELRLNNIRTVCWRDRIRMLENYDDEDVVKKNIQTHSFKMSKAGHCSASPRFVKCPTDTFTMPHHRFGHFEIKECPRFLKQLESIDIVDGRKGQLEVKVTGVPKPELKWYKNWIPLHDNDNIQIRQTAPDHYVLNIYDAQLIDSGLYTCKARNGSGAVSCSAMVHVEAKHNAYNHKPQSFDSELYTCRARSDSSSVNSSAIVHVEANKNGYNHKPNTAPNTKKTSYSHDIELEEDLSRIRRQLHKLAEDFRQYEEKDLLHRREVRNGKHRLPKV